MRYYIVTVRDRVADVYSLPTMVNNLQGYLRAFSDEVNRADQQNQLYKHPQDFEVFHLGEWDDETCKFSLLDIPVSIALADQLVQKVN